jgi:hypothetical protein
MAFVPDTKPMPSAPAPGRAQRMSHTIAQRSRAWYVWWMEHLRTRGRAASAVEFEVIGELTEVDLSLLDEEKGSKTPAVKRLSERHHALARHLAAGLKIGEAAAVCGYDISRVSILKDDPAFKELVKFYTETVDAAYAGMHETLAGMSLDAALLLRERMEDTPEKMKTAELLEVAKLGADRTGHGPSSTQKVDVHIGIGDRLEAARKRIAERDRMIDITPTQEAAE